MKKETVLVEEMTVNNSESVSSNISDTAVSEGSLIVQNLPTSKILYATRKNNTQIPVMGLSKRRDYTIKEQASCKEENKYEYHYAEQAIEAECSDFSENSNGAIEVEIEYTEELETKKNKRRGNSFKAHIPTSIPDTSKSAMASSKRFGANFASTRNKFKFDAQKKRKSQGYGQDFIKKKSKEHKILNYKLRHAVEKGDLKTIKEIIETDQKSADRLIDLNMKSQDQWTLLHYATSEGNYGIVKYLLDKGADPNTQASNQRTALHIACMRGHLSIVNILLKCNANINMTDMDGNTAVHLCSEFGHHDLLRFLLAKRPSLHIINNYDNSPVDVAADEEILYIFDQHITSVKKELIQNVAEINGLPQVKEAGSMTQRTKLVKIQDSLVCPSEESIEAKVEDRDALTSNCNKNDNKALFPYIQAHKSHNSNLNFLNAQNFHPEMTETYKFKEGRLKLDDLESYSSIISKEEPQEKIGTHSFVPLMILGKGSFGEVYLVQKHNDKRFYAMKVLQKDKLMGQNLVKYARTERNVLSYTKHPFIVGLNYAFQTKEKLFLLLDY